jgi:hypothetical protein
MATHELKRIDRAIMQTSADGGRRRIEVAENVTLMTGIDLSASAIMVIEQLATKAMRVRDLATCVGVTSGAITGRSNLELLEGIGFVSFDHAHCSMHMATNLLTFFRRRPPMVEGTSASRDADASRGTSGDPG